MYAGRGYVIEHCISALRRAMEERRYRAYVTDTLQAINTNLVKRFGGSYIKERWADGIVNRQDTRSGDDIAADVIKRAGLRLGQVGAEQNGI